MTEIKDSEKEQILSSILNSSDFKDSKRYQDLLRYLFEKSERKEFIKEIEIAIDLFDKDSDFDPNTNPSVRSYISNLRKKIEHYYLTTTYPYNYRLEIPKGQYSVNFIHVDNVQHNAKGNRYSKYIYLAVISFLILLLVYQEMIVSNKSKGETILNSIPNPIWKEFILNNGHPTLIVLGDYFFMYQKNPGGDRILVRNTKINSENDFQQYIRKYPGLYSQYEKLNYTYLRPSSSLGLLEILKVLGSSTKNIRITFSSQLKWSDLEKSNVIFIGTFKTLNLLDTLLSKTNIKFNIEPSSLNIVNKNRDTVNSFDVHWTSSHYQNDYSVLIKIPGLYNNNILFCMGFSEIGVLDAVNSAADPNFISRIQKFTGKDFSKSPFYFDMVSKCEGIELSTFHSNIKYFNLISDK